MGADYPPTLLYGIRRINASRFVSFRQIDAFHFEQLRYPGQDIRIFQRPHRGKALSPAEIKEGKYEPFVPAANAILAFYVHHGLFQPMGPPV